MGLLDDEIERQRQAERTQATDEVLARQPAASYPADLAQVINDFLSRRVPTETTVGTGGKPSMLRAQLRLKQPGTLGCWELFRNNGDGIGDSGAFMVLTTDGLLRVPRTGEGFQPIGKDWRGQPLRGEFMALQDGSLTAAVTAALAYIVVRAHPA